MAINRTSPKKGKVVDIPDAVVTIGTPTAGDSQVSVAFTATSPATGGPVQKYTAISNPGSISATGSTSPIIVTGLTNSTAYTFTVAAGNATGNGVFSSASASISPINPAFYESIATVTPSGTTVTFSSIPQTYKHLQVRILSRTTRSDASVDGIYLRMNGDTAANYSSHLFQGNGSAAAASASTGAALIVGAYNGADAQTAANIFSTSVWDILDYTDTNKYKTTRNLFAYDANGSGTVTFGSGNWRNTNAITSLTFLAEGTFVANSHFALYGIKG